MARQNKSNELAEMLRHQITSGQLRVNEQLEAISKLAKRHGTTVATVSKALANLEQSGYVERFPGKGVFVKEKKNCRLALVVDSESFSHDSPSISFMPILLNQLEEKCQRENWTYELFLSVNDKASAQPFLLKMAQNAFDVVLVCSRWLAENSKEIFINQSVFLIGIYPYKDLDISISFDSYRMIYDAVLELNKQGCQQIALIDGNNDKSWSKNPSWNVDGYYAALKSIGQLRNDQLYLNVPLSQQGGYDAFCELIKHCKSRPLGIVSVDSLLTLGVVLAALSKGLKLSKDVIIATHSNQGCGVARFSIPVIKFEYRIGAHIDRIFELIKLYNSGKNIPFGVDLMEPVKKVPSYKKVLFEEAFV